MALCGSVTVSTDPDQTLALEKKKCSAFNLLLETGSGFEEDFVLYEGPK